MFLFRRATAVLIAVMLLLLFSSGCEKRRTAVVGLKSPDFALADTSGGIWRLAELRGSVVLINFWATWCDACRFEMPALQSLYDKMKADKRFKLVSVLYRDDPFRALHYMQRNDYTFPLLIDSSGEVSAAYGLTGVPETFLVDKNGVLKRKFIGATAFDSPEALSYIRGFVEE